MPAVAMLLMDAKIDRNDPLLGPLLGAACPKAREQAVAEILSAHVYWRIDGILSSRFSRSSLDPQHRDDIRNEILVRLVDRLHGLTPNPALPIESFPDYVSVVAFNTFDEFARYTSPLRARLRNRLRYALRHDSRFAMWEARGTTLCGFSEWSGASDAARLADASSPLASLSRHGLHALLRALFDTAGKPIEFDVVVTLVADVQGITDRAAPPAAPGEVAGTNRDPIDRIAGVQYLQKLWEEIRELPAGQRVALLLNARDAAGESVVRMLPAVGIASIRQIANALSVEAEDFADLWTDLPLEDVRIASILKLTRQQVINLRRTARERLQRRMRGYGRPEQR